ncbi:unnamed protein product [Cochlearia groenlandica]
MEDDIGENQISSEEDDNETVNDSKADEEEHLQLSLTLGSASYSSHQISPNTTTTTTLSLRQAQPPSSSFTPPTTTWPSPPDLTAMMMSSSQYHFMTSSQPPCLSSSSLSSSLYAIGSSMTTTDLFSPPPSAFAPPSNQTPIRRPLTSTFNETRRNFRSQTTANQKSDTISPPFPWATNKRGRIQSLTNLESKQIVTITGQVQCKHCEKIYDVSYNLREKFSEIESIFTKLKSIMRERAPTNWTNPEPVRCGLCGHDKSVKPVIADRKHKINWLFLLLGQTLGYCTLEQLKNFCKHSRSHRTGAKDRVLYLTYLGLCKMLEPNRELFSREIGFRR